MKTIPQHISIQEIPYFLNTTIALSEETLRKVKANRDFLDKKLSNGQTYYGINTGFGSLCNVRISDDQLSQLQQNLVCSHATGFGDAVPQEIVKIMLLLKIIGLGQGFSGIHEDTINRLVFFYNEDILPVVYDQGSLGASGDLAPLAHLSLPLIGQGMVWHKGEQKQSIEVLKAYNLEPLTLKAKEGLALLNGTQFMSSYAVHNMIESHKLMQWADLIAAMSLDGFDGKIEPFSHPVHRVRPHKGQLETAENIRNILAGSGIQAIPKVQVQDPYSFRCIPQVHGATKDAARHIHEVFEIEINSVTDNPIVFEEEDLIISGGNFHGQPLALNLDFLAIAMAELGNISERRTYLLISGQRELPPFLAKDPGLNSGFMIAQYTAAAIVSQSKQYCTPASVDSIVSSNGQEDHVSMGANAATKLKKVMDNVRRVLAVELMVAAQALEFRRPNKSSDTVEKLFEAYRKEVAFYNTDRFLHEDMIKSENFLKQHQL
ncbi:MAG: histidine ammonia-lyase [Bacteroidetes bacterium 43-16]|nr:MAG: histidine ammonia-lyase [Bacteroidetes bacterium 43-16]